MNTFIITYDLSHADSAHYDELHDLIKECGDWVCITQSTWAVKTTKSSLAVRGHLMQAIDDNDALFVGTLSKPFRHTGLDGGTVGWLEDNL